MVPFRGPTAISSSRDLRSITLSEIPRVLRYPCHKLLKPYGTPYVKTKRAW